MMRFFKPSLVLLSLLLVGTQVLVAQSLPHLVKKGNNTQLLVNNKPFLMRGGELGNSSASSTDYMHQWVWPVITQMNLNTVIAPVYWELMEPAEGTFDFVLVDQLIADARQKNMKLILLWFGVWKNSMSCYAPEWVKTNTERFPRALNKAGKPVEILSPFSANNLNADVAAFKALMRHIKQTDSKENTVIMIQVENEIGMLPNARDYSAKANAAYDSLVPDALLKTLVAERETLFPETLKFWGDNGYKTSGTWREVFGDNIASEEIFMAWYFAQFTHELAKAGKAEYNLPMFVNAALNREGYAPGDYPSAGPLPHLMDIWRIGAPAIDILAPDIYFPNFEHWLPLYKRGNNPLLIPEAKFEPNVTAKMFYAFGRFEAMCFSPFSIESTANPANESITKGYDIIQQLTPLILEHQGQGRMNGVLLSKEKPADTLEMGGYRIIAKHDYTLGWSPEAKNETWPMGGAIIINTAPNEFWFGGSGVVFTFQSLLGSEKVTGINRIDEGRFINEKWVPGRRMNGDQDHQGRHLRIEMYQYGIQHLVLYQY